MQTLTAGYYDGRTAARLGIPKGEIQAAFHRLPRELRLEVLEDALILTDPRDRPYIYRED